MVSTAALQTWHIVAAVVHGINFLATTVFVGVRWSGMLLVTTCVFRYGDCVAEITPPGGAPVAWIAPVFFLLTAIEHLSYVTFRRAAYDSNLHQCVNPDRWYWFSASAGLMAVLILQVSGETSLFSASLAFMVTAMVMMLGHAFEQTNTPSVLQTRQSLAQQSSSKKGASMDAQKLRRFVQWAPTILPASCATLLFWAMVWIAAFVNSAHTNVPSWIPALLVVTMAAWCSFGVVPVVTHLSVSSGPSPHLYLSGEVAYIVLSFFSKTALAWIFLGGSARPATTSS